MEAVARFNNRRVGNFKNSFAPSLRIKMVILFHHNADSVPVGTFNLYQFSNDAAFHQRNDLLKINIFQIFVIGDLRDLGTYLQCSAHRQRGKYKTVSKKWIFIYRIYAGRGG